MNGRESNWHYVNGFRVLVSQTEIRLVWLQDDQEAVVLWLPRAVAEALVPALEQALAQQEQAAEGRPSEAQAGAAEEAV